MSDFDDTPTSEGATNVSLHQRSATPPFAREVVNIQGDANPGRAIGFNAEGQLTTLLISAEGGGEPAGPVELVDMAPLPSGTVIGRKSPEGGVPQAVTVAEMIALDPAASKTALGKVALADMANLAQGKLIARASSGTAVPEAVTVAQMIALDPAATKAAIGKVALSDMANLARGTLITRVSTSPNPGVPEAMTLSQLIAIDPEAIRVTLGVSEDPFVTVDTEAEFNTALAAGRSMVLRGEGTGGVISLTAEKVINARYTTIKSDAGAVLSFTLPQPLGTNPRAITVHADDVTLQNFDLTSTIAVASSNCYGLVFAEGIESPSTPGHWGHRLKLLDLHIHKWQRCISKDGSELTTPQADVVIERLYAHSAKEYVVYMNFGFTRLRMRDCRHLGKISGDSHTTTDNAMYGGSNWRDCSFENCHFGDVGRMGFEATMANYSCVHERTRLNWCRAENCGSMGFSLGYVIGGIYSECRAINVKQCGFELAGRVAGNPAQPVGRPSDFAQGIIVNCEVTGVTHTAPAYGLSIDGARDSLIHGCRIANVSTTYESAPGLNDGACGIGLTDCERISIQGTVFEDAGHKHIYCSKFYLPNTTGHHEFLGNTFRNRNAAAAYNHRAIYVNDQSCSIRQNVAYQKPTTFLGYQSVTTTADAAVCVDGVACAVGSILFGGTNLILNGPA